MCGTNESSLTTIKTSQAELEVCSSCEDLGTEVETNEDTSSDTKYSTTSSNSNSSTQPNTSSTSSTRTTSSRDTSSDLRMDYGETIKSAREDKGLSVSDLASQMNEKASHLRGIENEERQPTERLQKRLESELDISLTEDSDDVDDYESSTTEGQTLGDVVEFDNS